MAVALIAGALGVVGRALVEHLENDPKWDVIGLSRRSPDFETSAKFISVDLLLSLIHISEPTRPY